MNVLLKEGQSSSEYGALEPAATRLANAVYHNNQERLPVAPACLLLLVLVRVSPLDKQPINSLVPLGSRTQAHTQTLETERSSGSVMSREAPPAGAPGLLLLAPPERRKRWEGAIEEVLFIPMERRRRMTASATLQEKC